MKIVAVIVFSLFLCNVARAVEIHCPAEIASEGEVLKAPDGWTAMGTSKIMRELDGVRITDAKTFNNSENVYGYRSDYDSEKNDIYTEKWNFSEYLDKKNKLAILCEYRGTIVGLVRQLPENIKSCTTRFKIKFDKYKFIKGECH